MKVNPETLNQLSKDQLIKLIQEAPMASADAGILKTRKGALMVRVSDQRWPIAMYRRDWEILLSKVDLIKEALRELDIPEENPDRSGGVEEKDPLAAMAQRILSQREKAA